MVRYSALNLFENSAVCTYEVLTCDIVEITFERNMVKAKLLETICSEPPNAKLTCCRDRGGTRTHGSLYPAITPPRAPLYRADLGTTEAGYYEFPSRLDATAWLKD